MSYCCINSKAHLSTFWAARLRWLLIWAGIVTLVLLTVLASVHLVADVWAARGVRVRFVPNANANGTAVLLGLIETIIHTIKIHYVS